MSAIDLVILGLIKEKPISAYDIHKIVEFRNISKCVKISVPSIYKKVAVLEEKGFLTSHLQSPSTKEGRRLDKAIYSITNQGEEHFLTLMEQLSKNSFDFQFSFNAVILNFDAVPESLQKMYLTNIKKNIDELTQMIQHTLEIKHDISDSGMKILSQQKLLAESLTNWIELQNF